MVAIFLNSFFNGFFPFQRKGARQGVTEGINRGSTPIVARLGTDNQGPQRITAVGGGGITEGWPHMDKYRSLQQLSYLSIGGQPSVGYRGWPSPT